MANMRRRALGKGLGTLLPERPMSPAVGPPGVIPWGSDEGYFQIPVDQVTPNPSQPRGKFDPEELADLADSIRSAGVLNPILVRDNGVGYELIAGERRLRAAKMAGLTHVPARVQPVDRARSLELAIIENVQREQLNPIEEARAYTTLMQEFGLDHEAIARQVGRRRSSISNTLRLLQLPGKVQGLLEEGKLTAGHAKALLSLRSEEEILRAAEEMVRAGVTVRDAEKMTRARTRKGSQPAHKVDPNIADAELRLQRRLGTKVRIHRSPQGKGRIEIEFYSDEELMRLFELIEVQTH